MITLKRRQALQILGLAGATHAATSFAGAPFRVFSKARAADSAIPRRIVFFYTEQGTLKRYNQDGTLEPLWTPIASGMPNGKDITKVWSTTDHKFRDHHSPLDELKKKVLVLHGLDMRSAQLDRSPSLDAHAAAATHAL